MEEWVVEELSEKRSKTDEPKNDKDSKKKEDEFKGWSRKDLMDEEIEPVKHPVPVPIHKG